MIIEQIYTKCLAQASYYIESDRVAAVVDPIRDIDIYIEAAARRNASVQYIFITHFHVDFVSGHLELAEKTGAEIVLGPLAEPGYKARICRDGEVLKLGNCAIKILHTPGHTIESTCFLLLNEKNIPHAVFTGDTLFVGDAGRPDLLSGNLSAETLAGMLYDSIHQRLAELPDNVVVYPGHGAGSACGKNLGKETISSIGIQKLCNYVFKLNKKEFIHAVISDQPLAPSYFFKDAVLNKSVHETLDKVLKKSVRSLSVSEFQQAMDDGALVLDTRNASDFGNKHIAGAINIGLDGQFAIWAGTLLKFNQPLVIVADDGKAKEAIIRLARIGYDNVLGYLGAGINEWEKNSGKTDSVYTVSIQDFSEHLVIPHTLIDVRKPGEFKTEFMPGAIHIPLENLQEKISGLDKNNHYAIFCVAGYRSMIAVSILKRNGFKHLLNLEGGINQIKSVFPELIQTNRYGHQGY